MRRRTLARENALKILYQADITRRPVEKAIAEFWLHEEVKDAEVKEFSGRLVVGVDANKDAIDAKISEYATNWQLKRMAIIDRNILRIGVFELKFSGDIPPKVSINEAVELAKKFGDIDSSKFVNGILDKIHKKEIAAVESKPS
jgi:transcription antitermination factor NusB